MTTCLAMCLSSMEAMGSEQKLQCKMLADQGTNHTDHTNHTNLYQNKMQSSRPQNVEATPKLGN